MKELNENLKHKKRILHKNLSGKGKRDSVKHPKVASSFFNKYFSIFVL